jgi:hypothetical protein
MLACWFPPAAGLLAALVAGPALQLSAPAAHSTPTCPPSALARPAVFDQGNLFDFVQQQRQQWQREPAAAAAPGQPGGRAAARAQHLRDSLGVFLQVCSAKA